MKFKYHTRFPLCLYKFKVLANCISLIIAKECSCETMDMIPSGSDYVCEDSSTSEYIAYNGLHHR
jgi:hypothetical protein